MAEHSPSLDPTELIDLLVLAFENRTLSALADVNVRLATLIAHGIELSRTAAEPPCKGEILIFIFIRMESLWYILIYNKTQPKNQIHRNGIITLILRH